MSSGTVLAQGPVAPAQARVTAALLGCGAIAGPLYVVVSLAQALTRDGFELARHPWSVLANGDLGWIHVCNLVLSGLLTLALAGGARRALRSGRGARWAPRLLGLYGLGLVASGVFVADPVTGFPAGTTADEVEISWHGVLHFVAGGIGFIGLIAACLVLGARFAAEGSARWAWFSRSTGVLFAAGFLGIAASGGSAGSNLAFGAVVVLASAWLTALAVRLYGRVSS